MERMLALVLGTLLSPPRRDERGLSQSTETVILIAAAATIAVLIVTVVTGFVTQKLGEL